MQSTGKIRLVLDRPVAAFHNLSPLFKECNPAARASHWVSLCRTPNNVSILGADFDSTGGSLMVTHHAVPPSVTISELVKPTLLASNRRFFITLLTHLIKNLNRLADEPLSGGIQLERITVVVIAGDSDVASSSGK